MATLEKLVRAFEAVKISQAGGGNDSTRDNNFPRLPNQNVENRATEHTSAMASLASTFSQQGQNLLSKKDLALNSRDKIAHCSTITEALLNSKIGATDTQKLLSVGIETLLFLMDDGDPDVRTNANEALNKVIRGLSETQLGKIQVELFREIKKNGSARSVRVALSKFAALCHNIRPKKCRAYVQNLLPHLNKLAKRPEESLLETLSQALSKIMPTLGHFTNDNEIKNILKAFLPNISHSNSAIRRSAIASLVTLCQHSRKPNMFFGWLLNTVLGLIIPIRCEHPSSQILGVLLCIRLISPHLSDVLSSKQVETQSISSSECAVTNEQVIQVYELCWHFCNHEDHNIITCSLETLQALLQNPPQVLFKQIMSTEGIARSSIFSDPRSKFMASRIPSQLSIAPSLFEEDLSLDMDATDAKILVEQDSMDSVDAGGVEGKEEDDKGGGTDDEIDDKTLMGSNKSSMDLPPSSSDIYANIEIGSISEDTNLLFGRTEMDLSSKEKNSNEKSKTWSVSSENSLCQQLSPTLSCNHPVQGNIGSFYDEDIPLKYLTRFLASSFLLSGHVSSLVPDKSVKVSIKVLALNCIGHAVKFMPNLMGEVLFLHENGDEDLQQHIDDILRYHSHNDPQLRASVGVVIGQFVKSSLINNRGQHSDFGRQSLSLGSLLDILCKLLAHESSVTVRGALAGIQLFLTEMLHSWHASCVLSVLPNLVNAASVPYWLVKVEIADLLSTLPLSYIDHIENNCSVLGNDRTLLSQPSARQSDRFSHRIISAILIPLLSDQDHRVRSATSNAIVKLIPELICEGDLVLKAACRLMQSGHLRSEASLASVTKIPNNKSLRGLPSLPISPFDMLVMGRKSAFRDHSGLMTLNQEEEGMITKTLSQIIHIITTQLISTDNRHLIFGCLEVLSSLSEKYPPVLYRSAWSCQNMNKETKSNDRSCHIGLVTLVLSLVGEASVAGDLTIQQFIVNISANILCGVAVDSLENNSEGVKSSSRRTWKTLKTPHMIHIADTILQHIMRILCVYHHIVENITPSMKPMSITSSAATSALSPMKRKTKIESISDKTKSNSPAKQDKSETDEKEKKSNKATHLGHFAHLTEYIKLYDVIKNAHTNHKMSLEESMEDKLCGLLRASLTSLARLLEITSMSEFGDLAEELLVYLKSATMLQPTHTVLAGQQLLKCLFGSNVFALWDQLCKPPIDTFVPSNITSLESIVPQMDSISSNDKGPPKISSHFHELVFSLPISEIENDFKSTIDERIDAVTLSSTSGRKKMASKIQTCNNDKVSLSSYIKLFEPLVIKALKLYTISSNILLQKSVLQLLIHLVQIRVNYCLLDSDQIFIGYVIEQFDYIEEGQIKQAEELIPSMFSFLVLLSYERHHSKSIIGVPKIIQLCDGLMASGQPPLSHCILALRPLVEDLFLERSHSSSVDHKELETQREVICSMLLRLSHYHQVLHLISLILGATQDINKERWRKLSRQVIDTLLPFLSNLQINLDSSMSLIAVEEVLNSVCPSVYRPTDCILKALLTSPCELETTVEVERWVGGVLLLLRTLIVHATPDIILARLQELGLSMDYVKTDSAVFTDNGSSTFSGHEQSTEEQEERTSQTTFVDPLNVIQPVTQPEIVLARFLLEVIRVGVNEMKNVQLSVLHENVSSNNESDKKRESSSSQFLMHINYHLLLTINYIVNSEKWESIMKCFKDVCSNDNELLNDINESLLFVSSWYPSLCLLWCEVITSLDLTSQTLWTRVLRTCQRKSIAIMSGPHTTEVTGPSNCLALEFLRRCGLLVFSNFVVRHMQEGEWLTWLVVQHISDVVLLHKEPQINYLLQSIYSSAAASALLIQAIQSRCDYLHKGEYGGLIVSLVSKVHTSQSGTLITLLVERLVNSPYLVVSRSACALASQRLHLLLATTSPQGSPQISSSELTRLLTLMKEKKMDKKCGQLFNLLQKLFEQTHDVVFNDNEIDSSEAIPINSDVKLDLSWYLQVVRNRCSFDGGGGRECAELLNPLDYSEMINVMSGQNFNISILTETIQFGLDVTLSASRQWGDCGSSVETGDSEEASSGSSGGEAPLYTASKVILLQNLSRLTSPLPKPHHTFTPGGGNKYSERMCKLLSNDDSLGNLIGTLAPALVKYMNTLTQLPWKGEVNSDNREHILRFCLLAMEYLHWQIWLGNINIDTISKCLSTVDATLKNPVIASLLSQHEKTSYVCSMVACFHATISHLIKPKALPSLPLSLSQSLVGSESCSLVACKRLMQLIQWLDACKGSKDLPNCLTKILSGVLIGLSRMQQVNGIVRVPPDVWTLGWSPNILADPNYSLPPIPADLLQDNDVLKQFIFRMELLGCVGRQQFEETWMALLSVLNSTPNYETPKAEIPFINLSLRLAVQGITSLLVQTLLMPVPCNPHASTLIHLHRDKQPSILNSKIGHKLQSVLLKLQNTLRDVDHLIYGKQEVLSTYQISQLSVEYLVAAIAANTENLDEVQIPYQTNCYEFELRERQLANTGLDVQSCLHLFHYLYSSWLHPQSGLCSSVIAEVVKSVSCLCDLFTSVNHHQWVLEALVPLHSQHPIEDYVTTQYIIIATSKSLATLRLAKQDVSCAASEGVIHIIEAGLRHSQVSVKTCALHGLLYLLQSPSEHCSSLVTLAMDYILKYNDGKNPKCESHDIVVWEVWVYLVEHFESQLDATLPSTALQMALSTAATAGTSSTLLRQVLKGAERLVLVQNLPSNTVEVVMKFVMDLVLNSNSAVSMAALPLFITALYASIRSDTLAIEYSPENLSSDPEMLLHFLEKLTIFFDRIRIGYPHEAGIIARLLGTCLLDILPASQILNKVITEYISSHQPHPHLLASTLFQVFEGAVTEGGEALVQEWVLLSLSNFTQRTPTALAVWCLTCFFIAASNNRWLRAVFPSVQARLGKLEARDIQIFCLAGSHFRQSLPNEDQRSKFDGVFESAAVPGSPFLDLMNCIKS